MWSDHLVVCQVIQTEEVSPISRALFLFMFELQREYDEFLLQKFARFTMCIMEKLPLAQLVEH